MISLNQIKMFFISFRSWELRLSIKEQHVAIITNPERFSRTSKTHLIVTALVTEYSTTIPAMMPPPGHSEIFVADFTFSSFSITLPSTSNTTCFIFHSIDLQFRRRELQTQLPPDLGLFQELEVLSSFFL